jgi:hypothetical protein
MKAQLVIRAALLPVVLVLANACTPRCVNTVLQEVPSPSGTKIAVLYTRACGATTGPSTNVAVLDAGAREPRGTGNVLVLKDPVSTAETSRTTRLRWLSADTLEVSLIGGRAVQSRADSVDGIAVMYAGHSDRDR